MTPLKWTGNRSHQGHLPYEGFVVVIIFTVVSFLYYYDTIHNWFIIDDTAAIYYSMESLKEIFFGINYSIYFYTPLVPLSFKPDYMLFGMNPAPYHIHNILVLVLICFMTFQILRLYVERISAFLAPLIILISTPSVVCIEWVTLRQYLYSMLFALTVIYLFLKYKPDPAKNRLLLLIILILCELSFMGKEQFMALPLVLFIVSEGNFTNRISKVYPYFILLIGHFLLRLFVLGWAGGYFGFVYDLRLYAITTFLSLLTTSKILFGYSWFIVPVLIPLLKRPKKIGFSILIWLISLSISFFTMHTYPEAGDFRYWFIPAVLFSFAIGFNANFIRSVLAKAIFLLIIFSVFFYNTFSVNRDVKSFFRKTSSHEKMVTNIMLDDTYRNSLIIADFYDYVEYLLKIFGRYDDVKFFTASYPLALIAFYPEIGKDYEKVYEIREDSLIDITHSLEEKVAQFRKDISQEKPKIELIKKGGRAEANFACESCVAIQVYKKFDTTQYFSVGIIPYIKHINLDPVMQRMKSKDVELVESERLFYKNRRWYIDGEPVDDDVTFIIVSCINKDGRHTPFSDMLYFVPDR